jgi:ribonuclease HII
MTVADPTMRVEGALGRAGVTYVLGCDEVGRGALAGPVAVGVAVLETKRRKVPEGLRDSKMLSEKRREELAPVAAKWAVASSVGLASAEEIDRIGITAALGIAGARAVAALDFDAFDDAVLLLDGHFDYLSRHLARPVRVEHRIKADRDCGSVAAASVIAKVHRDRLMIDAHASAAMYEWRSNKGYASAVHMSAIDEHGPHGLHRKTWLRTPALFDALDEDALEAAPTAPQTSTLRGD